MQSGRICSHPSPTSATAAAAAAATTTTTSPVTTAATTTATTAAATASLLHAAATAIGTHPASANVRVPELPAGSRAARALRKLPGSNVTTNDTRQRGVLITSYRSSGSSSSSSSSHTIEQCADTAIFPALSSAQPRHRWRDRGTTGGRAPGHRGPTAQTP